MTTVADFVLARLREWGIHRIYGYPQDGINAFLGALDRTDAGPEFIQARHEGMAAAMASGHTKFTGELGCCVRRRHGSAPPRDQAGTGRAQRPALRYLGSPHVDARRSRSCQAQPVPAPYPDRPVLTPARSSGS